MTDQPLLMIVEDDAVFARTLRRSFERRDYTVIVASGPEEMNALLDTHAPEFAVIDLKLAHATGLSCVETLHARDPDMTIIVLTGYASIATAVQAIKLGATSYLAKPANTDDIERAFGMKVGDPDVMITSRPTSIKTVEWERISEVLAETNFNVSEAARRLGMHRRTLARKLQKRQVS
jgi:two-component system response regulator RegA